MAWLPLTNIFFLSMRAAGIRCTGFPLKFSLMYRYPAKTMVVDFLAPIFTAVKWIFVGGSFTILLVGLVAWMLSFFRKSRD